MVGGPSLRTSNPNGRVPTFRGNPVPVSEIGFIPGRNAMRARFTTSRAGRSVNFDNAALRERRRRCGLVIISPSYRTDYDATVFFAPVFELTGDSKRNLINILN